MQDDIEIIQTTNKISKKCDEVHIVWNDSNKLKLDSTKLRTQQVRRIVAVIPFKDFHLHACCLET
jgi:hypothetical protein